MKKLGDLADVVCCLRLGADIFGAAAIAFLFGQPGALGVVKVPQLGLEQAAGRPVLVKGREGRDWDPDRSVIAGRQGAACPAAVGRCPRLPVWSFFVQCRSWQ